MGEREITARADVYALGAMTYEMLLGEPPFTGPTAQAIVAKVMTERPAPIRTRRETVPPQVEDAVLTALAKLPADRFSSAAEFAQSLAGVGPVSRRFTAAATTSPAIRRRYHALLRYGAIALTTTLALWGWARRIPAEHREIVRFTLEPSAGSELAFPVAGVVTSLALSPDGQQVVYAATHGGRQWALDLRHLDQLQARTLAGTEGATNPEFSPDGRWIAFGAADGSLRKIAVDGTGLATLAQLDPAGMNGLAWLSDRELVFSRTNLGFRGLWRVSSDGGHPSRLSQFDSASGERLQVGPRVAEGGRLVFYSSTQSSNLDLKIGVVTAADGKVKVFPELPAARVLGLVDGLLVYVGVGGELLAAAFDTRRLEAGAPRQLLDGIVALSYFSPAALSASGSLLYQRGGLASRVVRVDLQGNERVLLDSVRSYVHPRLSPDGRRLALEVVGRARSEIWIADLAQGTFERLTREGFRRSARVVAGRKPGAVHLDSHEGELALVATGGRQQSSRAGLRDQ